MTLDDAADGFRAFEDSAPAHTDEHPAVIVQKVMRHRRNHAHIVVFANEKGGVGKSTMAFHCAVALSYLGMRVLTIDCDRRQQSLDRVLEARDASARTLKRDLPRPRHAVLEQPSAAVLLQEIDRLGDQVDFVVIDLPGHDSPIARRAIALADTLVTPINCSPTDVDALALVSPVGHKLRRIGAFAELVTALREQRIEKGLGAFDWIVARNRVRAREHRLIATVDANLELLSARLGFRIAGGLSERLAYRDMLPFGLSHLDLRLLPELGARRTVPPAELRQLVEDLRLPRPDRTGERAQSLAKARALVLPRVAENYRQALGAAIPVRAATSA